VGEAVNFGSWLQAAKQGDPEAMFRVAECYADGESVTRDFRAGFVWFEKAAKLGMIDAMFEIARCYCEGLGVCRDLQSARFWLEQAYGADHLMAPPRRAATKSPQLLQLILRIEKRARRENFRDDT